MNVLLTGASGFLGTHVLRSLAKRDVPVLAVSRSASAVASISGHAEWLRLDIKDAALPDWKPFRKPETVIHLAWDGLPNYRSLHHFESELAHQYRFLSALVRAGIRRLVVAGTCFEYGLRSGELSEDFLSDPRNPYAIAKDALRRQLEALRESIPFELTWARLFYMHGEGQPATSLYTQWRRAMSRGDASFPMSRGEQLRDFLPVSVVADTVVALALDAPEAGIVNVCSGTPISVRALVESWIADSAVSMTLELGRYPYPDYEPMAFWGSRKRLDRLLSGHAR